MAWLKKHWDWYNQNNLSIPLLANRQKMLRLPRRYSSNQFTSFIAEMTKKNERW